MVSRYFGNAFASRARANTYFNSTPLRSELGSISRKQVFLCGVASQWVTCPNLILGCYCVNNPSLFFGIVHCRKWTMLPTLVLFYCISTLLINDRAQTKHNECGHGFARLCNRVVTVILTASELSFGEQWSATWKAWMLTIVFHALYSYIDRLQASILFLEGEA